MIPTDLNPLIDYLRVAGVTPIIVGGYVRDFLLGIQSQDIDIELYGVDASQSLSDLLKPFGNVCEVGKSYGVAKLRYHGYAIDFSLPRTETKTTQGHRGFEVKTYVTIDFATAARRRDFTINAIGYNPFINALLDPYFGEGDLRAKKLRCVDPVTFIEDPLRVLRAVQFVARFCLTCDFELLELCQRMVQQGVLEELPKERIFEELKKLLMLSHAPSLGLKVLDTMGARSLLGKLDDVAWGKSLAQCDEIALTRNGDQRHDLPLLFASLLLEVQRPKEILKHICFHSWLIRSTLEIIGFTKKTKKIKFPPKPLVQGRYLIALGLSSSPTFKNVLDATYTAQLEGAFTTYDEGMLWLKSRHSQYNF